MIETNLAIFSIRQKHPEIPLLYDYNKLLGFVQRSKTVLSQMKGFGLVSYMIYFERELGEDLRETAVTYKTLNNRYAHRFTAKIDLKGAVSFSIDIDQESELEKNAKVCMSDDLYGFANFLL